MEFGLKGTGISLLISLPTLSEEYCRQMLEYRGKIGNFIIGGRHN
jgi:hypothetical protein